MTTHENCYPIALKKIFEMKSTKGKKKHVFSILIHFIVMYLLKEALFLCVYYPNTRSISSPVDRGCVVCSESQRQH